MGISGWVATGVTAWVALSGPAALLASALLRAGARRAPHRAVRVARRAGSGRAPAWERHAAPCAGHRARPARAR